MDHVQTMLFRRSKNDGTGDGFIFCVEDDISDVWDFYALCRLAVSSMRFFISRQCTILKPKPYLFSRLHFIREVVIFGKWTVEQSKVASIIKRFNKFSNHGELFVIVFAGFVFIDIVIDQLTK